MAVAEKPAVGDMQLAKMEAPQVPVKPATPDVRELSLSAVMPVLDQVSCAALDASVEDGSGERARLCLTTL